MTEEEKELLHSERQSLRDLLSSEGWELLANIAVSQMEAREQQDLAYEINSSEDLFELARLKAERRAIKLFLSLPETMIENITLELEDNEDG